MPTRAETIAMMGQAVDRYGPTAPPALKRKTLWGNVTDTATHFKERLVDQPLIGLRTKQKLQAARGSKYIKTMRELRDGD
uniref:Uncharacterized protein n=1 Tax=viral metagenome TaxID=1070528 RepID=A0A6M3KXC8_9ZZZZ